MSCRMCGRIGVLDRDGYCEPCSKYGRFRHALGVLALAALVGCGAPAPQMTPLPVPTSLPAGTQSVEADFYLGTLTLAQADASMPYLTVCGAASGGRVTFPNIPLQPGANTLAAHAFSGQCVGNSGSGTILANGFGTGTVVAGAANDLTAVFGAGATTLR